MNKPPHLLLLHGSNGCAAEMEPLAAPLRAFAQVHCANLPGHGGRPVPLRLSIAENTADLIAVLDSGAIERAFVVGYSTGGLTALHFARHHPERSWGACAIATRVAIDAAAASHWSYLAHPDRLARPGNLRAAEMLAAHGPGWKAVTLANIELFANLLRHPPIDDGDLAAIARPVMLVNANRDQLVPWSETQRAGKLIPGARLTMFYGLGHPLRSVPVNQVATVIGHWVAAVATS